MAEWLNTLSECQKAGESVGVLITIREFGNTEGHKIRFLDQSLVQYLRGMHFCDKEEEKLAGFMTWYACGIQVINYRIWESITSNMQFKTQEAKRDVANCDHIQFRVI